MTAQPVRTTETRRIPCPPCQRAGRLPDDGVWRWRTHDDHSPVCLACGFSPNFPGLTPTPETK